MAFSIIGGLVAFTVPLGIIGAFTPANADRVLLNGGLFGLAAALPLLLVFFSVKERREYADAPAPRPLAALRAAVKNPPLLFGLGIFTFTTVTIDIMQTILLYFITWCVRRQGQSDLIMGAIFVTALLALPLWSFVARRWSKKAAYIAGIGFWAAVQLVIITLGTGTGLPVLLGLCVLAGVGVGAAHVLPWSILPDAVEWDEWKTGARHEGTFYSLVTLAQKVASTVALPLCLLLLGAFGYRSAATEQPASALLAIRLITGPIPAVLLGLGIVCAALYPLDRATHARILTELEQRRAAGRRA
jgi:GPH family glycoside/pentoside/hexuronide:cation symporter